MKLRNKIKIINGFLIYYLVLMGGASAIYVFSLLIDPFSIINDEDFIKHSIMILFTVGIYFSVILFLKKRTIGWFFCAILNIYFLITSIIQIIELFSSNLEFDISLLTSFVSFVICLLLIILFLDFRILKFFRFSRKRKLVSKQNQKISAKLDRKYRSLTYKRGVSGKS